jgi:hypothetical protein
MLSCRCNLPFHHTYFRYDQLKEDLLQHSTLNDGRELILKGYVTLKLRFHRFLCFRIVKVTTLVSHALHCCWLTAIFQFCGCAFFRDSVYLYFGTLDSVLWVIHRWFNSYEAFFLEKKEWTESQRSSRNITIWLLYSRINLNSETAEILEWTCSASNFGKIHYQFLGISR